MQLKDMAERLPAGSYDFESIRVKSASVLEQNGDANDIWTPNDKVENEYPNGAMHLVSKDILSAQEDGNNSLSPPPVPVPVPSETTATATAGGSNQQQQVEAEWIEQYEPGVYITLVALRDGTRDLKRVRFRYAILFLIKYPTAYLHFLTHNTAIISHIAYDDG